MNMNEECKSDCFGILPDGEGCHYHRKPSCADTYKALASAQARINVIEKNLQVADEMHGKDVSRINELEHEADGCAYIKGMLYQAEKERDEALAKIKELESKQVPTGNYEVMAEMVSKIQSLEASLAIAVKALKRARSHTGDLDHEPTDETRGDQQETGEYIIKKALSSIQASKKKS